MIWDYFSKIYVISIPSSKRKNELRENFKRAKITNYEIIDFEPAPKVVNDGGNEVTLLNIFQHSYCDKTCENIGNNHLNLIKRAYTQNLDNVLIFEDDACFEFPLDIQKLERVENWLKTNEWDMFYLGYCAYPIPVLVPVNKDIVKIYSPYLAHSYAINRSGINYIIDNLEQFEKKHIDGAFGEIPLKKYGIWKSVCFQNGDPALYKKAMEKLKLNLSLKSLSKIMENVCVYVPIILLLLLIYFVYGRIAAR